MSVRITRRNAEEDNDNKETVHLIQEASEEVLHVANEEIGWCTKKGQKTPKLPSRKRSSVVKFIPTAFTKLAERNGTVRMVWHFCGC